MSEYSLDPQAVVDFWREIGPERWYAKDQAVDETIRHRFADLHERAAAGELDAWAEDPNGALALVLLLDQFSRNLHRGSPRMYENDSKALAVAQAAIRRGDQYHVGEDINQFFAKPFMHAEDAALQDLSVHYAEEFGEEDLVHAVQHREIVQRFGRFPHRNAILDRSTTDEEARFLEEGGFQG